MIRDTEDMLDDVLAEVRRAKPVTMSMHDQVLVAAFAVRLGRGEGAEEATKGAQSDTAAFMDVLSRKKRDDRVRFLEGAQQRTERSLVEAGYKKSGGKWKSPKTEKLLTLHEATHVLIMDVLTAVSNRSR